MLRPVSIWDNDAQIFFHQITRFRIQKKFDNAYKVARNKIPAQKASDPWADIRPVQAMPAPKNKPQ
jgi:hypothetical protein